MLERFLLTPKKMALNPSVLISVVCMSTCKIPTEKRYAASSKKMLSQLTPILNTTIVARTRLMSPVLVSARVKEVTQSSYLLTNFKIGTRS